jgi:hypothetical protein
LNLYKKNKNFPFVEKLFKKLKISRIWILILLVTLWGLTNHVSQSVTEEEEEI